LSCKRTGASTAAAQQQNQQRCACQTFSCALLLSLQLLQLMGA
jgi:hypothetical protein